MTHIMSETENNQDQIEQAPASIAPTMDEVLLRHDVMVTPFDVFGVNLISEVKVRDLRPGCLALLLSRNALAKQVGLGITELQHARQRITRLGLDNAKTQAELRREVAGAHGQIEAISMLSNHNASRIELLEYVIVQLAQALDVYADPANWTGRELHIVPEDSFGGAQAYAAAHAPVTETVVTDVRGNARLRNYDESAAADARARAEAQERNNRIAQDLERASREIPPATPTAPTTEICA